MKTKDAIETFGSIKQVANTLGLSVQAVYAWGEDVPPLRAYQLLEYINGPKTQILGASETVIKDAA